MNRLSPKLAALGALAALAALGPGVALATTREMADFQPASLIFDRSVVNQLTHDTYRDPFDELQRRPYNLLFANIGRHANLSPWQGQQGNYSRYLNALIGNNGAANVDNDSDAIQGTWTHRPTAALAWGVSGAFISGTGASDDTAGTSTFSDADDLRGLDVRAAVARQLSERRVGGLGLRLLNAGSEITDDSFEQGVGGFHGIEEFAQLGISFDVGLRTFLDSRSSWDVRIEAGLGSAELDEVSEDLDAAGEVVERFVIRNHDLDDRSLGIHAGYNRARSGRLGEIELGLALKRSQRELANEDLSYRESGGTVTPDVTLLGQEPVSATEALLAARIVFPAGETEMFTGADLGFRTLGGSTEVDAAGTIVNEEVDDSSMHLGLTVGLRQALFRDRLRFIVSGRGDFVDFEQRTIYDTGTDGGSSSRSTAQYAIGLEGVLANVTLDVAWLAGEEAPVVPVPFGLPAGSRRSVELDRLVFSAAAAW
jgi:hypothetical protein